MMQAKATLEFDLSDPEAARAHAMCVRSADMATAINDIINCVFRPARKHGYHLGNFESIEACDSVRAIQKFCEENENAEEIIGHLESLVWDILKQRELTNLLGY